MNVPLISSVGPHVEDKCHFLLIGSCLWFPQAFLSMKCRHPDIHASRITEKLLRSRGENLAAKRAGLLHALLPKLLHAVSMEFMFARKGAQRTTRKVFQTYGAFTDFSSCISCPSCSWSLIVFIRCHCHLSRSPFFGGDTQSLVAVYPMVFLTCLAAVPSCFALCACEL